MKEEKFLHAWKPPHRWGQRGTLELQKETQQQVCGRQNRENSPEIVAELALPSQGALRWVRAGCWGYEFGGQTPGEDQDSLLQRYSEAASMTQLRESRESSWKAVILHSDRMQDPPSWCSTGKESTCIAGDLGSIPRLGRSPGEGNGYPLQYSGLENSLDCVVHGFAKSGIPLSDYHFH